MSLAIDLAGVRRLEELAFRGWPALESRDIAGWRLRFAGGYTKRANYINALGPDAETGPATIRALEAAYRTRGQPPIWRLSPLAPPAIGVVQGDHMGLFDVLVMPHARRRGLARRITESLYAWAWQEGARFAYLQVVATNRAAMALYAAQGFR